MRVPRKDDHLNDAIEMLDQRLIEAQKKPGSDLERAQHAWASLDKDELVFIDTELDRCLTDRRYFMENYYVIRNEAGRLQALFPFHDHQEIIYEVVEQEWLEKGCCRLIILKPRQAGSTTWNGALIFHGTYFVPNSFSLAMAQDEEVSGEIYQRVTDAYHNLPWWMQAEYLSKQQGKRIIFQRGDESQRMVDPGLGSTLMISNAQKSTGVAIGRTIKNLLASEVSRWADSSIWTADIEPSLNAPDMLGILESTAYGRSGLYYNMWHAASKGESLWRALFIPVYRVRKYSLPVYKKENFKLAPEERGLRANVQKGEDFIIPLGFFKWRRLKIRETINATGSDETHYESYPVTPEEAFISSGFCAFPRKELNRQLRVNCCDPILIGEIEYTGMENAPRLHLHPPVADEILDKPERTNRFWVWEEPEPESNGVEYYTAADIGGGEDGNDYSDITVYKLGYGPNPDIQVAEWHGHMNPSHLARVIAAIGQWYNVCEVAVEYAQSGITTGNELQWTIDYPNLYRWKHLDKIGNTMTQHVHWMTTQRTREDAINRMNEKLLDHLIVIRNKFTIEEMRDFGRLEGEGKAQGLDNNDDAAMAQLIAVGASCQSSKRQDMAEAMGMGVGVASSAAAGVMPNVPVRYTVYDHLNRMVCDVGSVDEGDKFIEATEKKHKVRLKGIWRVVPVMVMKANTPWATTDSMGAASDLVNEHGVTLRDQMVTPSILDHYRSVLTEQRHRGKTGIVNDDND